MLKRLVHTLIFVAVVLQTFAYAAAACGYPQFVPSLPR
jgi:hypothetical protein